MLNDNFFKIKTEFLSVNLEPDVGLMKKKYFLFKPFTAFRESDEQVMDLVCVLSTFSVGIDFTKAILMSDESGDKRINFFFHDFITFNMFNEHYQFDNSIYFKESFFNCRSNPGF